MLKKISNLGTTLNKEEQKQLKGGGKGLQQVVCNQPYINNESTCMVGYHPHPTHGVCICCLD